MLKINDLISSGESFNMNRNRISFYESVEIRTLVKESYLEVNRELLSNFINKSTRGESDSTKTTKPGFFGKVLTRLKKIWGWIVTMWKKIVDGIRGAASRIKRNVIRFFRMQKQKKEEKKHEAEYKKKWEENDMDSKFRKDFNATNDGWNDNRSVEMHRLEKATYGQIKWSEVDEANHRMENDLIPALKHYINYFKLDKKKRESVFRRLMNDFRQFNYIKGTAGANKIIQPFVVFENRVKRQATNGEEFPEAEFKELEKRLDEMEHNAQALWSLFKEIYTIIKNTKDDENFSDKEKLAIQEIAGITHNFTYQYQIFGYLGDRSFTDYSAVIKEGSELPSGHPILWHMKNKTNGQY